MSVSTLVLLGLAVVWAIVLLPEAVKRISKARSGDSIRSFNHQLSSLQRGRETGSNVVQLRSGADRRTGSRSPSGPVGGRGVPGGRPARADVRSVAAPAAVSPAVRRRRQEVLTALGSATVVSLLCSVAFGGVFVLLFLVAAALLVAYVVALYQVINAASAPARHVDAGNRVRPLHIDDVHGVRVSAVGARRVAN